MAIIISGSIEVRDNKGQNHIIDHSDFDEDPHDDGMTSTFQYDNGDFSVSYDVEEKNNGYSQGDAEPKNCLIIQDNIKFSVDVG